MCLPVCLLPLPMIPRTSLYRDNPPPKHIQSFSTSILMYRDPTPPVQGPPGADHTPSPHNMFNLHLDLTALHRACCKIVQLGPHFSQPQLQLPLPLRLANRRCTSYWNAFLFSQSSHQVLYGHEHTLQVQTGL